MSPSKNPSLATSFSQMSEREYRTREEFSDDLLSACKIKDVRLFSRLLNKAWEIGHSCGYKEVLREFEEFHAIVLPFLKEGYKKLKTIEDFVGEHVLDAVDNESNFGDANSISFRLDGVVYTAIEDSEDGYRSCLKEIIVEDREMKNTFKPVKVVGKAGDSRNDTVVFFCVSNGKEALEVGTDHSDNYYPIFVSRFCPENLPQNKDK